MGGARLVVRRDMRHIPAMIASELIARCDRLFGYGWKKRLAAGIMRDYATVKRWAAGTVEVPDYVDVSLELLELVDENRWPARWKKRRRKT